MRITACSSSKACFACSAEKMSKSVLPTTSAASLIPTYSAKARFVRVNRLSRVLEVDVPGEVVHEGAEHEALLLDRRALVDPRLHHREPGRRGWRDRATARGSPRPPRPGPRSPASRSSTPTRATTRQARFPGRFRASRLTARPRSAVGPVEDQEVEGPGRATAASASSAVAHARQIVAARDENRRQGVPDAGLGFEEEGLHGAGEPGSYTHSIGSGATTRVALSNRGPRFCVEGPRASAGRPRLR